LTGINIAFEQDQCAPGYARIVALLQHLPGALIMKTLFIAAVVATIVAQPAHAEAGDVLIRLRGIVVAPNEESSGILPAFPGETASVSNAAAPEVDVSYMATDRIGFELIAATTRHSASGVTGTTGNIGRLSSTWVLPPTLTVQFHPLPNSAVRPYVGVGVNYSLFYAEEASSALEAAVGRTRVTMSDSFGWAVQAGVDIDIGRNLFLNLDIKYIDIDTTATLRTANAGTQRVRMNLDPLVFGVGIGKRF
jgi:outer membrane protein